MNFIKKQIKQSIRKVFKIFGLSIQKVGTKNIEFTGASTLLEFNYGHLESKKVQMAIDANNEPIPWFTYPAIDYLKQLDLSSKIMLEWGAGNSSRFFSKKVKELYSIEHDREWYDLVKKYQIQNQTLIHDEIEYPNRPSTLNISFDIILIDGIRREDCSTEALNLISEQGLIILDNSDRHPDIAECFRENGFIQVDFHGFGPINDYTWTTSIFMDRQINLKPLSIQPTIPIGGGY